MIRVKVCANKRLEDALKAVEYGADAVGFLVGQAHASQDFISPSLAREIVTKLPPFCSSVLVTHISDAHAIIELAKETCVSTIQLHGDSTLDDVVKIRNVLPYTKIYKAVHVEDVSAIDAAQRWEGIVDAILLDSMNKSTNQVGGTGKTHDWTISAQIVKSTALPVILAGGLTVENVQEAIVNVRPFGVDVNSGTKGMDGYKDLQKLKAFITGAKATLTPASLSRR